MRPRRQLTRAGLLLVLALAGQRAGAQGTPAPPPRTGPQRCLDCHAGIEVINRAMDRTWKAHSNCIACHKGKAEGRTVDAAHQGLIPNPGDLRVVTDTCGTCHSRFGMGAGLTSGTARDVVDRVLRSPMALATGEIAAVRYLWGEQLSPVARYGVRSVGALTDAQPPGTVHAVAELPHASNSLADHLLRTRCLQCHLWTTPAAGAPPFRGAGCAACHVAYSPDGRSRSGDPTISKVEPGHPTIHRIDRLVADAQCLTCHRDEGLGIGWNFVGWLSRAPGENAQAQLGRAGTLPVTPDVHAAAGMACIDCHDTWDVHGDGHVHSRGRTAVGIRCSSCHGTRTDAPTFATTRGHRLSNVEFREGAAVLVGKLSGRVWTIPRVDQPADGQEPAAHRITAHFGTAPDRPAVTCVACHAGEVQQHFMRSFALDERQAVPYDWGTGLSDGRASPVIQGRWTVRPTWSPTGLPMLGINAAGAVDPLVANFHSLRWVTDAAGRSVEQAHLSQTLDGRYGMGFRTVDPHRTQAAGRSCVSCHGEPSALGLGSDRVDRGRLMWPLRYAPDQVADAEGTPIAAFSTAGERPLNHEELARTLRRPACLECHVELPTSATLPRDHSPVGADVAHRLGLSEIARAPRDAVEPEAAPAGPAAREPDPSGSAKTERHAPEVVRDAPQAAGRDNVAAGVTSRRTQPAGGSAETPGTRGRDEAELAELAPFIGR